MDRIFLTEVQKMIQARAREFVTKEVLPSVPKMDATEQMDEDLMHRWLGEFCGLVVPEKYGGTNAGYLALILTVEEIAKASAGMATDAWDIPFDADLINWYGNEEQKQKWLPLYSEGKLITVIGYSEPESGTFPQGLVVSAKPNGDEWVINGMKRFNSNSNICDFSILWCRTGDKPWDLSTILVEPKKVGKAWSIPRTESIMGHRGLTACDVALEDCRVPKENLIGELNQGYKYLEYTVARVEAPGIAAEGLGIAEQALEEALFFAQTRMQPWTGKNITVTEGVRYRVADMAMDIDAGRGLLYRVCRLNDDGVEDTRVEAAEAKLFCGQMSSRVVNSAIILHAGYGYTKEFAIERLYRDQKLVQLFGGTEDVERLIVGRDVAKRKAVAQGGVRIIEPPK